MDFFLLSQVLAGVAFALGMASFQFKTRKTILVCWFGSALFNSLHFFALDQLAAGVLVLVTSIRFLTAAYSTDRRLMYLFLALLVGSFLWTYTTPLSLLALFSACVGTYGAFHRADGRIRLMLAVCSLTWVVHNTLAGSPVAVLMELSFLASNLVGWWRFYFRPSKAR